MLLGLLTPGVNLQILIFTKIIVLVFKKTLPFSRESLIFIPLILTEAYVPVKLAFRLFGQFNLFDQRKLHTAPLVHFVDRHFHGVTLG